MAYLQYHARLYLLHLHAELRGKQKSNEELKKVKGERVQYAEE